MSQTFSLVCHETKQQLWVGQGLYGVMSVFYSGQPLTMHRLGRFLNATRGKPIVLLREPDFDDYTEFESEEDDE